MEVQFNHPDHTFLTDQRVEYVNNSPDTLEAIYYHLFFNAFQPGSMMDEKSSNVPDPDPRIGKRISKLAEDETGYHVVDSAWQDGESVKWEVNGTVMKLFLDKKLLPGKNTELRLKLHSRVPVQIRRSGRNNTEGIDYSMAQWYPKIAEYDAKGWHADPYIAREFYGVWGNFDLWISLDSSFTVAATGELKNPGEVGKGYGTKSVHNAGKNLTWHFRAENVHDFVWAADSNYTHFVERMEGGPDVHYFFVSDSLTSITWHALPAYLEKAFAMMEKRVGRYPYPVFSVIQGGDGGMEYPMSTLILGRGTQKGLVKVTVHEALHSWFQGVLATNESEHAWMDEGFDTYFERIIMDSLFPSAGTFHHAASYQAYSDYLKSPAFESMNLFADHYLSNRAYAVSAYAMGCVFASQLEYIIGSDAFTGTFRRYFETWKFKHPRPEDFMRIAEKESSMELDWYYNLFLNSRRQADYAIEGIADSGSSCYVRLNRKGDFPMPLDVRIQLADGQYEYYTIPLGIMLGSKKSDLSMPWKVCKSWDWTGRNYLLPVPHRPSEISKIEIDPSLRLADADRRDNIYPRPAEEKIKTEKRKKKKKKK